MSGNPALSSAGCLAPVLTELFSVWQTYLTVGGLPEAAAAFLSARDIAAADLVLAQYLLALRGDFPANAQGAETRRIEIVPLKGEHRCPRPRVPVGCLLA
ncbi:hypothetical protein [Duodenibacillus massiliensis]|uniref:hypothetical protein n=1 Tax=Duodenibacillus massiliensis TaxID=1852381 RepID=UPI003AF08FD0